MAKQKKEVLPELKLNPGEMPVSAAARMLGSMLRDEHIRPDPNAEELERCRALCRKGNPFPLIAMQWPFLVIEDEAEAAIFRKHLSEERLAKVTEGVREACLEPSNPTLRLDWWQCIAIASFFDVTVTEVNMKGCTGSGKTGSTSIAVCLWFDVYDDSRITLTGRDKDHALKNIFGETKNWFSQMKHPHDGVRILGESITHHERHYIVTLNPDPSSPTAGEAFSGAHGGHTLYVFDENTSHPDSFVENAARNAKKICCLGNPRHRLGPFYRAFEKMGADRINEIGTCYGRQGMRVNITIGGMDCMNVAEGRIKDAVAPEGGMEVNGRRYEEGMKVPEAEFAQVKNLIPGQMDVIQFRARLLEPMPECFAHGRFPKEDAAKQIILASWIPRHEAAHDDGIPVTCLGVDVAVSEGKTGDSSAVAFGSSEGCRAIHLVRLGDAIKIAEEVLSLAKGYNLDITNGQIPVCIDYAGGYGRGVGDYLKTLGVWVIEFQPGGASQFPRNYANMRAEGYATLGLRLDPAGVMGQKPWALPKVNGLREELTAPERIYAPDMVRFRVHPKDEIRKALGRSPDLADALTYLFHAVRIRHNLDQWLFQVRQRPLICYPSNQVEIVEVKKFVEEPPKSEYDDIAFDWKKPNRPTVVSPSEQEPWHLRYLRDN